MTIKNILIIGAGNKGAIENFYKLGFEKSGVSVEVYDISDQFYEVLNKSISNKILNKLSPNHFYKSINEKLLAFLHGKKYDVIIVFKGMELFPETIKELKQHAVILANYNSDHPFIYFFPGSGNKNVLHSIQYYDMHFSYSKNIAEQLRQKHNKEAHYVPFGYNSNFVSSSATKVNPYVDKFLFIGAYDNERASFFNRLHSDFVEIYGNAKWRSRNMFKPYLRRAYQNRSLHGLDYVQSITDSSGVINLLRKQNLIEDSHNMRTFEVPGYGGLLISQKTSEQLEFFEEDKEAFFFETIDELKSKLQFLLSKPSMVDAIKAAGHKRAISSGYSYDERSKQLLECLQRNF